MKRRRFIVLFNLKPIKIMNNTKITSSTQNQRNVLPADHNPYRSLKDIDDTPDASKDELRQLEKLSDFMKAEGMTDRFGITLLHKHFEVADDETLVETCDPETRTLTVRPYKKAVLESLSDGSRETQWRWDGEISGLTCLIRCVNSGNGHGMAHLPLLGQS